MEINSETHQFTNTETRFKKARQEEELYSKYIDLKYLDLKHLKYSHFRESFQECIFERVYIQEGVYLRECIREDVFKSNI